ncbi:MAG: TaqI-like C-terminal specificity domain-containing protein [Chloroherpetonaceae bacterium]|nr:TaqI-like C-terminal specificity domain-containing protein [Chloroherpetonaceae bacterium]
MTDKDYDKLKQIEAAIQGFNNKNLYESSLAFYKALDYQSHKTQRISPATFEGFIDSFSLTKNAINQEKALVSHWQNIEFIFQFSDAEITRVQALFETGEVDRNEYQSFLFFTIQLKEESYKRSELVKITRELNVPFKMPVIVLFHYGNKLTLSIIDRRLHKKDTSKDVLEKVTLIKDIDITNPQRAHKEILKDLSLNELYNEHKFTSFVELHKAWKATLNISELNKKFFQELSNWYFWAMDNVSFPDDLEKKKDVRNATNLIRLITRVIFIWFIKEKSLVPDALFRKEYLEKILKDFNKNKKSANYYNAILQNLFFGTLNQKMDERKFAKDGDRKTNEEEYTVKNLYRYADLFKISENEVVEIFKDIPFLNGGLFDCLDNPQGKNIYVDGFSRNPKKQAYVPDYIFFSEEIDIDLNKVYATKNKKYKSKGLFNLLHSYKFTIAENTPIEEEIALDPELLGKVFENLLASYNPETQTTARKQTGSFYTPREIVNYMVDESLLEYLKNALLDEPLGQLTIGDEQIDAFGNDTRSGQLKLEEKANLNPWKGKESELNLKLRDLFAYTVSANPFNYTDTHQLISAINRCKILDPACGSGAFPMGVLHKLVHLLGKLDPDNSKWRTEQEKKIIGDKIYELEKDKRAIEGLNDAAVKEKAIQAVQERLKEIKDIFNCENNFDDYSRKLFLIENCIYGIDIQPIAVQISKLRFFISLIIDQNKQASKENFGIRSLPNLETKFVAANTLIGLDKPAQTLLRNPEIEVKENQLKELRHKYFTANTRKEKLQYQKQDKKLRQEIAKMLESDGWQTSVAKQIVAFDPYDQNTFAPWFDPEWMFGLTSGFDIVIGNPPYIFTRDADFSDEFKDYISKIYFSLLASKDKKSKANQSGKINLFALFILRGLFESRKNGIITYIVPNNLLRTTTYDLVRKYLLENSKIDELVDLGSGVFDNVTASTIIFRLNNRKPTISDKSKIITNIKDITKEEFDISEIEQNQFLKNVSFTFNLFADSDTNELLNKIYDGKKHLGDFCIDIIEGIVAHKHLVIESKVKNSFPMLEGKTIRRYGLNSVNKNIIWNKDEIHRTRPDYLWEAPVKILIQRISGGTNPLTATIDIDRHKTFASINNLLLKEKYKNMYEFFVALLNSKIWNWYYANSFSNNSELTVNISKTYLEKLPVVEYNEKLLLVFKKIVDCIIISKRNNSDSNVSFFERLIDAMVYELYLPEEIKAGGAEVLKHLGNLPELNEGQDEKNLKTIEKVYKELSDPKHPISAALQNLVQIEEVKIIEGIK